MMEQNQKSKIKLSTGKKSVIIMLFVAFMALGWGLWYYMHISKRFEAEKPVWIHIPKNAGELQAVDSIVAALGDDFGKRVADMWSGDVARSRGAYLVKPGERAWEIARRITKGGQTPVKVTFNNIRTLAQLSERIDACMDFSAQEFMEECYASAERDSITVQEFEAQFFPDTYEMYWSASPADVIKKIRKHYNQFWNEERIEKAKKIGLTPLQVSVLASIAEEESNQRDERGKIARLYINRLEKGMLLQADPTVKFATGDFAARRITRQMLNIDSPYNTYRNIGLPPGIIRMPEARTIDAILNSKKHNYIYMCARPDGSGYHDFTSSYTEHLKNAQHYRAVTYGKKK